VAATYFLVAGVWTVSSGDLNGLRVIYLDPADYTVGSLTTKLRLRMNVLTNATAPTNSYTMGLYPISASGGGINAVTPTFGAVTFQTSTITTPALSTTTTAVSSDTTIPVSAGYYAVGLVTSTATSAANSRVLVNYKLQVRHT
jgi:hypothetical protein